MPLPLALAEYRWLVSPAAERWLELASTGDQSLASLSKALRKELSAAQTHLVLEQAELRRRARAKFSLAERMFFTSVALQQASDEESAAYKAGRFPVDVPAADLCCGIGGDLLALARRGPVLGVDRDPVATLLAAANICAAGLKTCQVQTAAVYDLPLESLGPWHLDPDRRPQGRRTTQVELYEPGPEIVTRLLTQCGQGALKLAPAAEALHAWQEAGELEWISRAGECKQQLVWFGDLARSPGRRSATVLRGSGEPRTISGTASGMLPLAERIGRYLFDPDAAVLAARLTGTLAHEHLLAAVAPNVAYLTGDQPINDAALTTLAVQEVLPLDLKRVKTLLREREIGRLEIKLRGIREDPAQLYKKLRVPGDRAATLVLSPHRGRRMAILAQRVALDRSSEPEPHPNRFRLAGD